MLSDPSSLNSVHRALELLKYFEHERSITVTAAAELLDIAPSSAHRLLTTLREAGFVRQPPDARRYEAGPHLIDIALGALARLDLRAAARPHLESLSKQVPAQVWLIRLDVSSAVSYDVRQWDGEVLATPASIRSRPVHTLASGKLLLARLSRSEVDRRYPEDSWPALTRRSIRSKARLLRELEVIRGLDYAVQVGENSSTSGAVAVPVRGPGDDVLAALAISGPVADFDENTRRHRIALAMRVARDIHDDLLTQARSGALVADFSSPAPADGCCGRPDTCPFEGPHGSPVRGMPLSDASAAASVQPCRPQGRFRMPECA